jgi:chromate transporter
MRAEASAPGRAPGFSAFFGLLVTMVGIMLPSTTLTYLATRWGHRNRDRRGVRAFKQGMAPVVVGLLIATGWVLAAGNHSGDAPAWHLWLLSAVATLVVWRTRVHLLWLLGAGALLGAIGFV